jgi:hypothetical protein
MCVRAHRRLLVSRSDQRRLLRAAETPTSELRRGFSAYSPLMARAYDEIGQYGTSVRASFRLRTAG